LSATALANGWQKLGEVQASRRQALQPATGACQTLANMQLAQPKQHQATPSNTHGVPGRSSKLKFSRSSTGFFGPIQNVFMADLANQLRVLLLDVLHRCLNEGLVALCLNHQAALAIDYLAHRCSL